MVKIRKLDLIVNNNLNKHFKASVTEISTAYTRRARDHLINLGNTIRTAEEERLLTEEKRQLEEELKLSRRKANLVNVDELTQILNRRGFSEDFDKRAYEARRHSNPLSLVMLDIDYFKTINDTFGHLTGDYLLKEFSGFLKEISRAEDSIGRYGGEEFLLLLPQTKVEGAYVIADRIRNKVNEKIFAYQGQDLKFTISGGVTSVNYSDTLESTIERADQLLYSSKNAGRNKVTSDNHLDYSTLLDSKIAEIYISPIITSGHA